MNVTFCEPCRADVTYSVKEHDFSTEIKGIQYDYKGETAYCNSCGAEVYVAEINDFNLNQLSNEIRKRNGIIELEKIKKLPERYSIGKRPLSELLGWGELTLTRYIDGDMPTKQYSEILKRIYDDPNEYLRILDGNKNILSDSTYRKTLSATNSLIQKSINNESSKIEVIALYYIYKCKDITPLILQKLLYYTQGFHFAFYDTPIFNEDCEAWVRGPVYRNIYNKYSKYCLDEENDIKEDIELDLTTSERDLFDSIIKNFSCYGGNTLSAFTHKETPWIKARNGIGENIPSNSIIYKSFIEDYFKKVKLRLNMINTADIGTYSQKMFENLF